MRAEPDTRQEEIRASAFTAADVESILRERGWLTGGIRGGEMAAWLAGAAALLGPHAESREALGELLALIFCYDAAAILAAPESHTVLVRTGARDVLRALAHHTLDGGEMDSARYKELIAAIKAELPWRGRELFHTIRLALAGRAGEGALDRVILLLDRAAGLDFAVKVKSTRQRILEFCAAVD